LSGLSNRKLGRSSFKVMTWVDWLADRCDDYAANFS